MRAVPAAVDIFQYAKEKAHYQKYQHPDFCKKQAPKSHPKAKFPENLDMQFSTIVASSLAFLSSAAAAPAAAGKFGLKVQYMTGTGKFDNTFLSFNTFQGNEIVALADGGTEKSEATPYTIKSGAIHVQIPPNMVISSGQYSTNAFTFGETVIFKKGAGSNGEIRIDNQNRLAFHATQGSECTFECWNICPLEKSKALSLGATKGNGCIPVIIKAVAL